MPLVDLWPPAALRVRCGDLELRLPDGELLAALAALAAEGIHDPASMPFAYPWTRGEPIDVARSVLQYHWRSQSQVGPDQWNLELAVLVDGQPVGFQAATAKDYPVTRSVGTGSWLGQRFQGAGIGTRMRLVILHLIFDELDAEQATTGAFEDNPRSFGVTRRLGYLAAGSALVAREGAAVTERHFVMPREVWRTRPAALRLDVTYEGTEPLREMLGIAREP